MERRRDTRVKVSHPVLYISQIYPRSNVASTVDLSFGGARIESLYTLDTKQAVEITIAIPRRVLKCRGRVVHVCERRKWKTEAGIQFLELPGRSENDLKEYLVDVIGQEESRYAERDGGRPAVVSTGYDDSLRRDGISRSERARVESPISS